MDKINKDIKRESFALKTTHDKIYQLEKTLANYITLANQLKNQIELEEQATGIFNPESFAYPVCAKNCRLRLQKLKSSIEELEIIKNELNKKYDEQQNNLKVLQLKTLYIHKRKKTS